MVKRLTETARRDDDASRARLPILKALGDNTRYAIYLELARSPRPRSTSEIAASLDLHANTVRPHLERMREVGLIRYETHSSGVGRPQHRYFLAPDAPALGLEAPSYPLLAGMLAATARLAGADPSDAVEVGREVGRHDAGRFAADRDVAQIVVDASSELGFDPAAVDEDGATTIAFTHCPFGEVAATNPELVCALHRGMVEGLVEACGSAQVDEFRTFADRPACQAIVSGR
ncbi:MAG: helix-turn-helix domain-containing protein [Actinomycetota bacterium]